MPYLHANAHAGLYTPETLRLGDVLGHLLRSTQLMEARTLRVVKDGAFTRTERTAFGEEVGHDEIHWWVFEKESDLAALRLESIKARDSLDRLERAAIRLKSFQATTTIRCWKSFEALLTDTTPRSGRCSIMSSGSISATCSRPVSFLPIASGVQRGEVTGGLT